MNLLLNKNQAAWCDSFVCALVLFSLTLPGIGVCGVLSSSLAESESESPVEDVEESLLVSPQQRVRDRAASKPSITVRFQVGGTRGVRVLGLAFAAEGHRLSNSELAPIRC